VGKNLFRNGNFFISRATGDKIAYLDESDLNNGSYAIQIGGSPSVQATNTAGIYSNVKLVSSSTVTTDGGADCTFFISGHWAGDSKHRGTKHARLDLHHPRGFTARCCASGRRSSGSRDIWISRTPGISRNMLRRLLRRQGYILSLESRSRS
jgi:hypothetical protein